MRFFQRSIMATATIGAAAVIASAGIAVSAGLPGTSAKAGTTSVALPISTYSHMLVDPVHQHIFFSSGSSSSSILVTDYSGNTVATIPNETGATGLALSSDGSTVYAALPGADAVSAISTSTLTETARFATGSGVYPAYVAYTSGKIWFGYNDSAAGLAGIGSIDPSDGTVTLAATGDSWYSAPMLAANPDGELVAGQPGISPTTLASYDVSGGTATVLHAEESMGTPETDNLRSLAITPDGKDVVTAAGYPYVHQVFKVADLSTDGQYDSTNYPDSVAIGSDGTVFAGSDNYYGASVFVYAPGNSSAIASYTPEPNSDLAPDGLAVTPDDSDLFAVSTDVYGNNVTLNIIANPAQASSTLSLTGPATAKHGSTVTFSGTLSGPSAYAGGQKLTVTRVDPADPNGVALPDVTTAADGSFSFTDTTPKTPGQDSSTVTYTVSYAGSGHLTASNASASVTVSNTGS